MKRAFTIILMASFVAVLSILIATWLAKRHPEIVTGIAGPVCHIEGGAYTVQVSMDCSEALKLANQYRKPNERVPDSLHEDYVCDGDTIRACPGARFYIETVDPEKDKLYRRQQGRGK